MKRAFSLIEMIFVMILIGILAAIALPQYMRWAERSRATEAKLQLDKLIKLEWTFYLENGRWANYLPGLEELDPEPPRPPTIGAIIGGICNNEGFYFAYGCVPQNDGATVTCIATRCRQGGKEPNYSGGSGCGSVIFGPYWLSKDNSGTWNSGGSFNPLE